eukprot:166900_1
MSLSEAYKDMSKRPEYYYPPWNPTNDPTHANCGYAYKLTLRCYGRRIVGSRYYHTNDNTNCIMRQEDVWLCLRSKMAKTTEDGERMLSETYPFVADKTKGFRFRHVWKFRDRPPPFHDDPEMSETDYTSLREAPRNWKNDSLVNMLFHAWFSKGGPDILEMAPKEYLEHLNGKINELNDAFGSDDNDPFSSGASKSDGDSERREVAEIHRLVVWDQAAVAKRMRTQAERELFGTDAIDPNDGEKTSSTDSFFDEPSFGSDHQNSKDSTDASNTAKSDEKTKKRGWFSWSQQPKVEEDPWSLDLKLDEKKREDKKL